MTSEGLNSYSGEHDLSHHAILAGLPLSLPVILGQVKRDPGIHLSMNVTMDAESSAA